MESRRRSIPVSYTHLYRPEFEHDNCGIGAVVNIKGKKTHDTVANALKIVENLEHRAGKDAEGKTGDGVGILLQISDVYKRQVYPLASKVARSPPDGKLDASGSPFTSSLPEKSMITCPSPVGEMKLSCFSAVTFVIGWNQCV